MEHSFRLDRTITILLFIGLFLNLLFMYFAQERLYNWETTGLGTLGTERYLRIFSVLFIFFSVFLTFSKLFKIYSFSIYFSYLILLIYITLNYTFSGADLSNMTQFMDSRGIGTWVCLGLLFVSYDDKRYEFLKKFLILSVIVISIFSIYNLIDFGVGQWRGQALSKYRVYATNLVWICPYVFLMLKYDKKFKFIRFYIISIGILLALITQTRSFLIIYFLTLFFDFYNTKNKAIYTLLLTIFALGLIYLILNTEMFASSLELLINRGVTDTRSQQLSVFLKQLNFIEIITGSGFFAGYQFGYGQWYAVDNQWLYLLWWGGLIPFLAYFYLTAIIPLRLIIGGRLSYQTKVECFVLIIWVLALIGLAIYTTMSVDFFFFIICIIQGRILYKYSIRGKDAK